MSALIRYDFEVLRLDKSLIRCFHRQPAGYYRASLFLPSIGWVEKEIQAEGLEDAHGKFESIVFEYKGARPGVRYIYCLRFIKPFNKQEGYETFSNRGTLSLWTSCLHAV